MIYLVTGPDNSGKDTIIRALQSCLEKPAHVFHYSAVSGTSKEDIIEKSRVMYAQSIDLARYAHCMLKTDVIFNRFWEGEMIYGPMYRNYTEQESRYVLDLETLDPDIVKGIFVTANPDTLLTREDGLSQSKNDIVKIAKECRLFYEFINQSRYKFTTINTTYTSESDIKETLQGIINANV